MSLPKSIEGYIHRAGRVGRLGRPGRWCVLASIVSRPLLLQRVTGGVQCCAYEHLFLVWKLTSVISSSTGKVITLVGAEEEFVAKRYSNELGVNLVKRNLKIKEGGW